MKKIGIVVKDDVKAVRKADELEEWMRSKGLGTVRRSSTPPNKTLPGSDDVLAPSDLFCVLVLGGDGTFLSAVRWIGDQDIPVLGVKFGEIGFLAETAEDSLFAVAEALLANKLETEPRMRLLVRVIREKEEIVRETVLNDVVINKGALARLANIITFIDRRYLTTYRADGLIIATPTGSTAYSLAAGGPIIHPDVAGIILTPISPFTLTNRPLMVPDSVSITIKLAEKSSDIVLTFDGQAGLEIGDKDTIIVEKGPHPIRMITIPDQEYFDVLKTKLRWSGGRA